MTLTELLENDGPLPPQHWRRVRRERCIEAALVAWARACRAAGGVLRVVWR